MGLINQIHRFIYRIKNVGLINQAPTDKLSPYNQIRCLQK